MPSYSDPRLNHVLQQILHETDDDGVYHQILNDYNATGTSGTTTIHDIMDIPFQDIYTLKWKPAGKQTKELVSKGVAMKLIAVIKYIAHMNQTTNNGVMMAENDFTTVLDDSDFTMWRYAERHNNVNNLPVPPPPNATTTTAATTMSTATDPIEQFKKGVKRDKSLFPKLRSEQFFENWLCEFVAEGNSQCMEHVFNEAYSPTDATAIEVFRLQKVYMYSVFTSTLLTDKGKEIVRDHHTDSDAQAIWKKLLAHMKTSTSANIAKEDLAKFFSTSKLDSRWRGTSSGYIAHWREKMRIWETMTPPEEHYTDLFKKRMVITAVQDNVSLKHVQQLEEQRITAGDTPFTFTKFMDLLESTAARHDHEVGVATGRSRRVVNLHDMHEQGSYIDNGDSYWDNSTTLQDSTDTDIIPYSVYETVAKAQNRPFFPKHIWDKISPEVRAEILNHDWSSSERKKKGSPSDNKSRLAAQLHQVDQQDMDNREDVQKLIVNVVQETVSSMMKQTSDGTQSVSDSTPPPLGATPPIASVNDVSNNPLMAFLSQQHSSTAGDIRRVLATSAAASKGSKDSKLDEVVIDGRKYRACVHNVRYNVTKSQAEYQDSENSSRIDRCSNGFYSGADMRLITTCVPPRFADVQGIDSYTTKDVPIGTVAGVVNTMTGPIVVLAHQSAHSGKGKSIWSVPQMEAFGAKVDDRSLHAGGKQRIITQEGYVIPISIRQGLPSVDVRPPTDEDMANLPHVVLTSDAPWDPTIMDKEADPAKMDPVPILDAFLADSPFDARGNYRYREVNEHFISNPGVFTPEYDFDDYVDKCLCDIRYGVYDHNVTIKDTTDYKTLRPFFLWASDDVIKKTIDNTTQWGRTTPSQYPFKMHYKSPFPAGNIPRRSEAVATDYVYADTPAIDDGSTGAQFYYGLKTEVVDVYGCKTDAQFVDTLEDNIRKRGAMDKLISDRGKSEISTRVHDILRHYIIGDWQSEPYHEHQNPAERKYQDVKGKTNQVLDFTGAPAYAWLLAMTYVCYIMNLLASHSLGGIPPLTALTGQTQDISHLFLYSFWDHVYVPTKARLAYNTKPGFPSETTEETGRFVGFGDGVGTDFTFKVLLDKTNKIVYRSYLRPVLSDEQRNLRVFPTQGESEIREVPEIVKSPPRSPLTQFQLNGTILERNAKFLDPDDLLHRTYLTPPDERGQRFRAKIVQKIVQDVDEHGNKLRAHPEFVKFLVRCEGDRADEIITYNQAMEHINEEIKKTDDPNAILWTFEEIIAHEGPLKAGDPSYKGSSYNLLVKWSDGSSTYEPLSILAVDSPVTCARYGQRAGLLDMPGWKRFQRLARRDKKMLRMENQAKLRSKRSAPIYKYGFRVPRTVKEALEIDKAQDNSRWKESMALEISQLQEYETFRDLGKGALTPAGYKRIQVHMVFDIKHDGRHKSRMVAGGHMTDAPVESVYSGVVSLRSLRMVIFLAELNGLELWGADIGNAYLEAKTKEKVYIIGGPEFGSELEGHTLLIDRALYGLKSSGARWHDKLFDILREMGWQVSKADNDVWMRANGECYEYIAVYVDDLAVAMKDPQSFMDQLCKDYGFKLKGVGPLEHHLGTSYARDPDGTLCASAQKYIEKMVDSYTTVLFPGEKLNTKLKSALPKNDHPELDDSPLLDEADTAKYLSMIGALHWLISLGRFDVHAATVSLARFRVAPRRGHLERAKGVYGYLAGNKDGAIRYRTGEPDYSELPDQEFDWMRTVYGNVEELVAKDAPPPLGKRVILTSYVDANLYHDLITGRALTGILHLLNGTPIDWYSKRQATVETATYGSEFVAARIATDQIIDLRITLRYLGVPIGGSSILFGDNKSVVTSSTIPHSGLNKRHNALSYHRVREAIAAKILKFFHISGNANPADILSKHTGHADAWPLVQPLLFWRGQPAVVPLKKQQDTEVQVIGECQDLKRTEASKTVRANMARYSSKPFIV